MENTPNLINLPVCLSGNPISQSLYKLLKQEVAICDLTKSIAVTFIIRYMRTFFLKITKLIDQEPRAIILSKGKMMKVFPIKLRNNKMFIVTIIF